MPRRLYRYRVVRLAGVRCTHIKSFRGRDEATHYAARAQYREPGVHFFVFYAPTVADAITSGLSATWRSQDALPGVDA